MSDDRKNESKYINLLNSDTQNKSVEEREPVFRTRNFPTENQLKKKS